MDKFYKTNLGTLYHGDCFKIMKKIPDKSVNLILTDPPYKILFSGAGNIQKKFSYRKKKIKPMTTFESKKFLQQTLRLMDTYNGYFFCSTKQLWDYISFAKENDFLYDVLTLAKSNPLPAYNNSYMSDLEFIVFIRESGATFVNKLGYEFYKKLFQSTVAKNEYGHPTQKTEEQISRYIRVSSKENDVVFDPFLGTGTTAVVCENLKRQWIGVEISEEYCEIAKERIANETQFKSTMEI